MPECISMNGCSRKGGIAAGGRGKNGPFSGLIDLLPRHSIVARNENVARCTLSAATHFRGDTRSFVRARRGRKEEARGHLDRVIILALSRPPSTDLFCVFRSTMRTRFGRIIVFTLTEKIVFLRACYLQTTQRIASRRASERVSARTPHVIARLIRYSYYLRHRSGAHDRISRGP